MNQQQRKQKFEGMMEDNGKQLLQSLKNLQFTSSTTAEEIYQQKYIIHCLLNIWAEYEKQIRAAFSDVTGQVVKPVKESLDTNTTRSARKALKITRDRKKKVLNDGEDTNSL